MSVDAITYLIRVSVSILILYGLYRILFRERTFFQANRVYLIVSLALSFVIPLISISWKSAPDVDKDFLPSYIVPIQETALNVQNYIYQPLHIESPLKSRSFGDILLLFYWLITLYFLSKFFIKIRQLTKIIKESKIAIYEKTPTLIHPKMPVSTFLSYLFWKDNGSEGDHIIYEHEKVHIRQWHSLDIILIELTSAILWFNPIVKLFKHEIQLLHEYIADAYVVQKVADKSSYVKLLYKQTAQQPHAYAQTFGSFLPNRLRMIVRRKSSSLSITTYLLIFPVIIGLTLILSSSANSEYLSKISDTITDWESREIVKFSISPKPRQNPGSNSSFIRANYQLSTKQLINMVSDGSFEVLANNHKKEILPIMQVRMVNLNDATEFYWNSNNPPEPFNQLKFTKELEKNSRYEIVQLFLGRDQLTGQVEVHLLDEHLQSHYVKFENNRFVAAPYLPAHGNYTRPTNYIKTKVLANLLSTPTIPIVVHGEEQILHNTKIVNTLNYGKELNRNEVIKKLKRGILDNPLSLIGIASQGKSYIISFSNSMSIAEVMQNLDFEWGKMKYSNINKKILPESRAWKMSIAKIKEMFNSNPILLMNGESVNNYILTVSYLDLFGNQTNSELQVRNGKIIHGHEELAVIEDLLKPREFLNGINITVDGKTTRTHKRVFIMN